LKQQKIRISMELLISQSHSLELARR